MDFDLSRIDYALVEKTCPGCLKLLPADADMLQQKVVVGDGKGVLQCFSVKNEEPFVAFKTLPGKEITSIQLAGATGTPADKIFAASGNEVRGYTKKGKVFFALETATTERITSIYIHGNDLIISSANIIIHYKDVNEVGNYVCDDRVIDLIAIAGSSNSKVRIVATLATKTIVLLENNHLLGKLLVRAGPSCLMTTAVYGQTNTEPLIFYGAKDGSIGMLTVRETNIEQKKLVEGQGLGSISCLSHWSRNGNYMLVGRHDGSIQILQYNCEHLEEKPRVKFSYFCGEAVTSVVGGCISSIGVNELLVATYSGRIFGLRPNDESGESQKAVEARMAKLESEIAKLEKQVLIEREKYQKSTKSYSDSVLSAPPLLSIDDELTGMNMKGWQELELNCIVPIDMLLVHSKEDLLIQTESAAIISLCPAKKDEFLATVRCQAGTMQIVLQVKPKSRPKSGVKLKVYLIPIGAPRIARLKTYSLGCLMAYSVEDTLESTVSEDRKPWCVLNVSGSFSAAEVSSWLTHLLPGEIPRPASKLMFVRRHAITGTAFICQYQRTAAVFRSEDISCIYILKNVLSNVSINKKIPINIKAEVPDDYLTIAFHSLENKLNENFKSYNDKRLRENLRDLDIDTKNVDELRASLCSDYIRCFDNSNDEADSFELFVDIVIDWFKDFCAMELKQFKGDDVIFLKKAIFDMNVIEIVNFFKKFHK